MAADVPGAAIAEGILAWQVSPGGVRLLRRVWVATGCTPETTPVLQALPGHSLWCADHSAVFPSVTRVSAASVTTGCHPARHGLHGNRMGLFEGGRIVVRDVGSAGLPRAHAPRHRRARCWCRRWPSASAGRRRLHRLLQCLAGRRLLPRSRAFRPCLSPRRRRTRRAASRSTRCARCQPRRGRRLGDDRALLRARCWAIASRPSRCLWLCDPDHTLARRAARLAGACRGAARRRALRGRGRAHRRRGCAPRATRSCC